MRKYKYLRLRVRANTWNAKLRARFYKVVGLHAYYIHDMNPASKVSFQFTISLLEYESYCMYSLLLFEFECVV